MLLPLHHPGTSQQAPGGTLNAPRHRASPIFKDSPAVLCCNAA